jgi:outer membrane lipoprotein SlyB
MYNMNMTRRALGAAAIAFSLALTSAALAQAPTRIRGQIEKVDGAMLSLKARDGTMLNVKVADDARVAALVKATLADIKTDSFIGIAGIPEADGSIKAFSIHIFLPAQRGVVPDRHGPWDAKPGSTMTNGYVENMVTSKDGETLMVKHKDGEKKIIVTKDTVIAAVAPGKKEELIAGTPIIIMASEKQADGSVLAKTIYVGRAGPPAM